MSFGYGASDFVMLSKFAWTIYNNVKDSRNDFKKLGIDVESLLVSIGSLDKGHTRQLISDYVETEAKHPDGYDGVTRLDEVRALREGLNNVIMPFYALFMDLSPQYQSSDPSKKPKPLSKGGIDKYGVNTSTSLDIRPHKDKPWRRWDLPIWTYKLKRVFGVPNADLQELRSRFAVQATNLSLFMTRLTHMQLQQQTELLTLKITEEELLDQNWRYSHDIKEGKRKFREDVARYVYFLLRGGTALSEDDLNDLLTEQSIRKKEEREKHRRSRYEEMGESVLFQSSRRRMMAFEMAEKKEKGGNDLEELDDDARRILERALLQLAIADEEMGYPSQVQESSRYDSSYTGVKPENPYTQSTSTYPSDQRPTSQSYSKEKTGRNVVPEPRVIIPPGAGPANLADFNQPSVVSDSSGSPSPSPSPLHSPRPSSSAYNTRPRPQASYSEPYINYTSSPLNTSPYGNNPQPQANSPAPSNSTINSNPPPSMVHVPLANVQRSKDMNSHLQCNNCAAPLKLTESFYRCATGKCANKKGDSFDLCLGCYGRGFRCRRFGKSGIGRDGRRKAGCGEMVVGKFGIVR